MLQDPILVGLENDHHFLECILRGAEGNRDLEVTAAEATPCCKSGDNYMSSITRVLISGCDRSGKAFKRSVLMKRQPANVVRRLTFRCDPAFRNETCSYETIVPLMAEFAGCSMPFPECLHASSQLIVLQDLKPLGFGMADRLKGLDLDHSLLALKALAQFHGTSLAMKHSEPEKFQGIRSLTTELAFSQDSEPVFGASVENGLKMALIALEEKNSEKTVGSSWTFFEAVHKLNLLRGSVFRRLRAAVQPLEPLGVLCHGDLWLNNMLFRYENNTPTEVKFVDLQVMRYSSLATDILYFLCTSVEPSVLSFYHDDLIVAYHQSLTETLEKLAPGAPQIAIAQINDQIEDLALFGLLMGFLLLPAITVESDLIDLDSMQHGEDLASKFEQQREQMMSAKYRERVRSLVLYFIERNFI
ncbi:Hypothetical protein NTJ_05712 [Nesidiocoris tenuis]|uniref:CHK kinase-like domain-containing protein n=1 Tax=Nesidiocoris tenuis TaxID=355587 RepID=A0ABN7AKZ5_9HEMI|nr:Hypothetical protein NTJ_05712 [Nesidiocoris tenuis]